MKGYFLWAVILSSLFFNACKKSAISVPPENVPGGIDSPTVFIGNHLKDSNSVFSTDGLTNPLAALFVRANRQSLIIPSNPSLQIGRSDLTISAWVKFNTIGNFNQVIASKDNDSTVEGSEYWMGYNSTTRTLQFQVETPVKTRPAPAASFGIPPTGIWIFVVGWYDHIAGKVHIQINGGPVDSASAEDSTRVTNTYFSIGSDVVAGSFLDGSINSVGFWKRVLSAEERQSLYNLTFSAPAPPVGNGRDPGTIINGASRIADVPAVLLENGHSLNFNGTSQYIKLKWEAVLNPGGSALSTWFKTTSFSSTQMIVGTSSNANAYVSLLNSSTVRVQTDGKNSFKDFSFASLQENTWNHLVLNRDNQGNSHVYLNGMESGSGGQPQPDYPLTINQIGRYWNGSQGSWYSGQLSELRLYTESLSDSDIASLYHGSETVANPSLYYKANEISGPNVLDYVSFTGGLNYANLPPAMINEPESTFISWWDLSESSGTRFDSRSHASN